MDDARSHLRGFARTIPMFLMAYGDRGIRLSNFDDYTPDDVFEEITGITEAEFRLLRDGQEVTEENGTVTKIPGLFDEAVFDQSVQEFLDKKEALADYFDDAQTENIFAYIPQQKTSLVFTPQPVVMKDAHLMHMYAPYSFARAALENASAAVWLLAPDDRGERILRRLRFAATDIRGGEEAKRLIGATGPKTEAERLDEVRALARRRGVDEKTAVKPARYSEIVKAAGDTRPAVGMVPYLITWRMCSGRAHGDFWTTINVLSREELPGAPSGLAHLKITANVETLLFAVVFAVDMAETGWRLYDERSCRRSRPDDRWPPRKSGGID